MAIVFKFNFFQRKFPNSCNVSIKLCNLIVISGFILYIFSILFSSYPSFYSPTIFTILRQKDPKISDSQFVPTNLRHLVFGLASSPKTWRTRRWYIETWWHPNITRGFVFLDRFPSKELLPWPSSLPPFRISQDTSRYKEYDKHPNRHAIRMTNLISELFNVEKEDVRWYILIDDDTVLFLKNLVDVLSRYDHNKFFYIGMNSESRASNVLHSYDMAFGGGGCALSFPLAKALVKNMDVCIKRYPTLYGSDHILQSCVADLGVSLTREKGFHQVDVHSDISGLLSAHPQSPLVSLHHLDFVNPIFPYMNQKESLYHLINAAKTDESRLLQQSICYDKPKNWSFSISWGYTVQLYASIIPPSILQRPLQTFTPWSKFAWPLFVFNTRIPSKNPCEAPHIFFFDNVENKSGDYLVTSYSTRSRRGGSSPPCLSTGNHSTNNLYKIYVISPTWKQDLIGHKRECCDVMRIGANATEIKLRDCLETEIVP